MFGGLLGSAETLTMLSENWDKELRSRVPLPIRYFKADEARGLSGEFSDWREEARDEKVRRLAALVDRDDVTMVLTAVDLWSHRTMESQIGDIVSDAKKHPLNQPYLMAFLSAMSAVTKEATRTQMNDKPEVFIDEHVVFRPHAKEQYKMVREMSPAWLHRYMPAEPMFRDDKDVVLLQAADLLMGNARMAAEKTKKWPDVALNKLLVTGQPFHAGVLARMTVEGMVRAFGARAADTADSNSPPRTD
jgi:hypothetical protein